MARLIFGVVLFTTVFAQATIVPKLNPFTVTPDLVLLLLFSASMYLGVREGLGWLFVAGILTDVLAMDPLGANGLALLPAVLAAGPARTPVFRANILIPMGLMLLATVAHALALCAIRGVMPDITIALQALLHAVLFPFIYFALRWLE
jgi:rod shape-determining protein MreD